MRNHGYRKAICIASIFVLGLLYTLMVQLQTPLNQEKNFTLSVASHKSNSSETIAKSSGKTNSMTGDHSRYRCPLISLSQLESAETTIYNIPLIYHQIFIYDIDEVPFQYVPLLQGCRKINSDVIYILWTNRTAEQFVIDFYPAYYEVYMGYSLAVMKTDLLRVMLIYHFGGIYSDMDMECRKPFSEHLDAFESGAIIDQERKMQTRLLYNEDYVTMNSVLIARKRHPFFKFYLEKFLEPSKHTEVLWKTGPFFLRKVYLEYIKQKRSVTDMVQVAPPHSFNPIIDPIMIDRFNSKCQRPFDDLNFFEILGCLEWERQERQQDNIEDFVKDSILIHRLLHLVYPSEERDTVKRVDPCKEVDIYKPLL